MGKREKRLFIDFGFLFLLKLLIFFVFFVIGLYFFLIFKIFLLFVIFFKVIGRFLLLEELWLLIVFFLRLFIFLGFGRNEDNLVFLFKLVEEFDVFFFCVGLGRIKFFFLLGLFFLEMREGCLILFWLFCSFLLFFLFLLFL